MNEEFDPTLEIGISGTGLSEEETKNAVANIQAADIEKGIVAEEEAVAEEAAVEATTPEVVKENEEGFTAKDYAEDTLIGLGSGGRKIASNIITIPERAIDFFNGEMEEEMNTEEGYQTEWDQFMYGDGDPIVTKTWWGGLVEGATEVVGTIAATGGAGKIVKGAGLLTHLRQGALVGAKYDLFAKNENQDNITGSLKQRYPWLDTPFSTGDGDSPLMRKMKHVVEGMGIGAVFDATLFKLLPVAKIAGAATAGKAKKVGKTIVEKATDVYDERAGLKAALDEDLAPIRAGAKEIGGDLKAFRKDMIATDPAELNKLGRGVRNALDLDIDDLRNG